MSDVKDNHTAGIISQKGLGLAQSANQSRTTWEDLLNAGLSKEGVFDMFEKKFGVRPKDVYLNSGICEDYQHYCNNNYSNATYSNKKVTNVSKVGNLRQIKNSFSSPATYHVQLSASKNKSTTITVTQATSISFTQSITIGAPQLGLGSEFSFTFNVENSVGSSSTTSKAVTTMDSVDVELQSGRAATVEMDLKWTSLTEDFQVPFNVSGWVGADFGKKVDDHYYWFLQVDDKVEPTYMRGIVDSAYDIYGSITVNSASDD